ncbi:hypothetical protein MOQ18_12430 [Stenotrophomonas maltophilia]|uniref:hypothetical protein n=1 Tax=Stenotrophomonas maltophilia TaxID=40324 RepID=UPI001F52B555|nr:hypothetical protein [Stenotrophomonas maltophilia]MCI1156967.1 hypothetical protein [Stenotrophomonas maltophilia]
MLEALFVATAEAAPAATAAANYGTDWKWLVPVITLILGFGLKWFQDWVTENRREKAQKLLRQEQRFDQMRARRIDAERANLLALQPMLLRLFRAVGLIQLAFRRHHERTGEWHLSQYPDGLGEELRQAFADIVPIRARLHSDAIAGSIDQLNSAIVGRNEAGTKESAEEQFQFIDLSYQLLQVAIGGEIRRLEDEHRQLDDSPY